MKRFIYIFFTVFSALICQSSNHVPDLVVIVNAENTTGILSPSEVKLIYLRKITRRWSGIKKNIIPVDRKGSPETRRIFLNKILGMTEDDLDRYYAEREYQNAEMPPVEVASDAEMIEFVSTNIGAIGYVSSSSLSAQVKASIKIVFP